MVPRKPFPTALAVALLLALVLGATACGATQTTVQVKSGDGGIVPTFSMSVSANSFTGPVFSIGPNAFNGPNLNVSSNTGFVLKARDAMATYGAGDPKNSTSIGRMQGCVVSNGNYINSGTAQQGNKILATPMKMKFNGGSMTALSTTAATDVTVRDTGPEFADFPLNFEQDVVVTDPVLQTGQYYDISVLLTGTAK